jgi:DNA replication licensing factor MCM5
MRPADRVAIHEAMEQQTISIAKAGITTVLNSRASVLAAANPIYGRYDDMRSAGENIDLMTTILSRFDLIFIVRDIRDEARDKAIARHVMGVHIGANDSGGNSNGKEEGGNDDDESVAEKAARVAMQGGALDIKTFKKFVMYCRSRCSPRLSQESSDVLASSYVKIRDDVRRRAAENGGDTAQVVPITVRQLEALVRLSESQAKMRLKAEVEAQDIAEALRLFRVATMAASETDANNGQDMVRAAEGGNREEYLKAETFLKSRVGVGQMANKKSLVEQGVGIGMNAGIVARVLAVFCRKGDFLEKSAGKQVYRVK